MRIILMVLRLIVSLGATFIAVLGVMILWTPNLLESSMDVYIVLAMTLSGLIVGIIGLMTKRVTLRNWLKVSLSSMLLVISVTFFILFVQKGFAIRYLVTSLYTLFLSLVNLYFLFEKTFDQEKQASIVATFILFTMVEVTLGFMQNIIHATLALIALLALFTIFGAPYFARQRLALLFAGEHEKLRKKLSPKALAYDRILKAYSHLYCGEFDEALNTVDAFEKAFEKKGKSVPHFEYMCHSIVIETMYFSGAKDKAIVLSRFEKMKSLNQQLFKRRYPMALPYQIAYLMNVYDDQEAFKEVVKEAIDFEAHYDFKRQSNAFYTHRMVESELMKAEMLRSEGLFEEAMVYFERVYEKAVQPLHKIISEQRIAER